MVGFCFGLAQLVQAQSFNRHFDAFNTQYEQTALNIESTEEGWMVFSSIYEPDTISPDSIIGIFTIAFQRIDALGDIVFEKKFKISNKALYLGWADCCDTVRGGGFVSSGTRETPPIPTFDVELVRYNSLGDTLWTRSYGSSGHFWIGAQVKQTPDGGFVICGYTDADGSYYSGFALKTDSLGVEQWRHTYGLSTYYDDFNCVILMPDGYVLAGRSYTPSDHYDFHVTRIDSLGNVIWNKYWGSPYEEPSPSLLALQDGRLLLGGAWGTPFDLFETPYVVFLDPATGDT
ncbi:MAG: hypothetical protein WAT41_02285, partial [Flavobacteriales bacterium]